MGMELGCEPVDDRRDPIWAYLANAAMHSLIPAYRELHRKGKFPGFSVGPYVERIGELVRGYGARTLLDYGCGAGKQYTERRWHEAWGGLMPTLYDPGTEMFHVKPTGQFDGVLATDVLEHIPEDELDGVIADLAGYARLWCFVSVCCRPAKKNKDLPCGNAHVTIKSAGWWETRLRPAFEPPTELYLAITP
jgi:hypothetical protein